MKKFLMKIATVFCCTMMSTVFMACSEDNEDEVSVGATQCTYEFTLQLGNNAEDQQNVVKTVVEYPDHKGEMQTKNFAFVKSWNVKPALPIEGLPVSGTITITETLKEDIDLLQKEAYKVGLAYELKVYSMDSEGGIIGMKSTQEDTEITIPSGKLTEYYPQVMTLNFKVDKQGNITIE